MEEIVSQVKWAITNHTKYLSPSEEDVYIMELVEVLYYELLLEN